MKLLQRRDDEPSINLTPLIDVVFLLLIFFMVSTTFNRETEISIDLPEAGGPALAQQKNVIEVGIDRQGDYFINQKQVASNSFQSLKRALREVQAGMSKPQLIISADAQTPHQAVVTAMDAARQVGLVRLTFATRQRKEDQP